MISLHFHGPFSFIACDRYLFDSEMACAGGIYLWTIENKPERINFIEYVGEAYSFANRHREHLIQITGLNYRILDPVDAISGKVNVVWNGMWRDKTTKAPRIMLENYSKLSRIVPEYLKIVKIFLAPIDRDAQFRKHIEGCISKNLRLNHPDLCRFYPSDNAATPRRTYLDEKLILSADEKIAGLDADLVI
jgi:hypothetical protein